VRSPGEQLGDVLRDMAARGFSPRSLDAPGRAWVGDLQCRTTAVRVAIHVIDWEFLSYPRIKVLSGVDQSKLMPHLFSNGSLCYFRAGEVVLDMHRPAVAIAQCIVQAQSVLERLIFDPAFRREDLHEEFEAYWLQSDTKVSHVLLGTIGTNKPQKGSWRSTYWHLDKGDISHFLLGDDDSELHKLAVSLNADTFKRLKLPCWLFETNQMPAIPAKMPTTVGELFSWMKSWDRTLYLNFQRILGNEREYVKHKTASFAIRSPVGWLGFGFELNPLYRKASSRTPKVLQHYLHNAGSGTPLFRLLIHDVSAKFVHSRNLTHPDLRNKQIILVGCGAIGSHVAQTLVRLGAGAGSGRLTLIDPDILLPENLGRHVLGYPYLFELKANSLAIVLQASFPLSTIEALTESALEFPGLFAADLVIEATGDEAVATAMNTRHVTESPNVPVVHSWILGNGEAVQAMWVCGDEHACYRCLRKIDPEGKLEERFPVLKDDTERRQIGCRAFTPYAISAPVQAAGQVAEMIVDWLKSRNPRPRFRTLRAENANVQKTKNQDVDRLKECPACGRGSS